MLNMFRTLIHPSTGACDVSIASPHWLCWGGIRVAGWSLLHGYHPKTFSSSSIDSTNLGGVLVCSTVLFHTCLSSVFTLQPVIFILLRSFSTWSIHLNLGLPTGLVLYGLHSVIFLAVLVFSILITWATHFSLCDFINFIVSSCSILCLNSSFVLIPHVPPGFCVGPQIFLNIFPRLNM